MSAIFQSRACSSTLKFDTHRVFRRFSSKNRWKSSKNSMSIIFKPRRSLFRGPRDPKMALIEFLPENRGLPRFSGPKIDILSIFSLFQNWGDGDHFLKMDHFGPFSKNDHHHPNFENSQFLDQIPVKIAKNAQNYQFWPILAPILKILPIYLISKFLFLKNFENFSKFKASPGPEGSFIPPTTPHFGSDPGQGQNLPPRPKKVPFLSWPTFWVFFKIARFLKKMRPRRVGEALLSPYHTTFQPGTTQGRATFRSRGLPSHNPFLRRRFSAPPPFVSARKLLISKVRV